MMYPPAPFFLYGVGAICIHKSFSYLSILVLIPPSSEISVPVVHCRNEVTCSAVGISR